jgi:formylglycine-generating enzyme required for sulfatase activity
MDAAGALRIARRAALAAGASLAGCSLRPSPLPPLGEALIVVDTDMAVPQLVNRLRVDLYAEDGTWYESRDIVRPDPNEWPASFSVYSADEARDIRVLVRLRVYSDGLTRQYQGERYVDLGSTAPPPGGPGPTDLNPRLVKNGADVTPSSEPQPAVTVDQLLLVRLHPGTRGRVNVTMRGACAGTMAQLSQTPPFQTPTFAEAATCLDTAGARTVIREAALDPDMTVPQSSSLLGTFGDGAPCDPNAPPDPRAICIPGGAFLLGSPAAAITGPPTESTPLRIAVMGTFWIDRHEVTVGQVRAAVAQGFVGGDITLVYAPAHDGPLGQPIASDLAPENRWCSWSTKPIGRENYAISCVDYTHLARPYCQWLGGDLPTEAQWEYAATAAGRPYKARYPWGDDPPTCDLATWGRSDTLLLSSGGDPTCAQSAGIGPQPSMAVATDVTPLGVHDLAGGLYEWMLDTAADYAGACWTKAPQKDPSCTDGSSVDRIIRGGAWWLNAYDLAGAVRNSASSGAYITQIGLRCAFAAAPGKP